MHSCACQQSQGDGCFLCSEDLNCGDWSQPVQSCSGDAVHTQSLCKEIFYTVAQAAETAVLTSETGLRDLSVYASIIISHSW